MEPFELFRNLNLPARRDDKVILRVFTGILLLLLVSACATGGKYPMGKVLTPEENLDVAKVGKPYQAGGRWYYPKFDPHYSEIGTASWYGEEFHRNATANGETFDKNGMTAAHKTLPLPSIVRVTNLENGKSVTVRVNDRGPFSGGRLIDVSKRAASELGFLMQGTAKVRVDYLREETAMLFPPGHDPYAMAGTQSASRKVHLIPEANAAETGAIQTADLSPPTRTLHPVQNSPHLQKTLSPTKSANDKKTKKSYYIQAGSYKLRNKALAEAKRLSRVAKVEVVRAAFNGTKFYRVRLGPIASGKAAEKKLAMVLNYGFKDAVVISN